MANSIVPNYTISGNSFQGFWKLTRAMKAAGWTTVAHSDGTTKTAAGTNNNDSWGSNANPLLDVYPTGFSTSTPWIVMRGPSTVKLNFTTAPSTFLRGEIVTQATTGATGEVSGYVWDSASSTGWIVINPQTGTFNGTNVITGGTSAATVTPTSYKLFYREIMFSKTTSANTYTGSWYYIMADSSAESAQLFSTLATSAGATASVAPGQGGTSNAFPAKGIVMRGAPGSTSGSAYFNSSGIGTNAQVIAVNNLASSGVSADGSFWITESFTGSSFTDGQYLFGFTKLDNYEPGDIDPYAFINPCATTFTTYIGAPTTTSISARVNEFDFTAATGFSLSTNIHSQGYYARDCSVTARDKQVVFFPKADFSNSLSMFSTGLAGTLRIANHPQASSTPLVRQPIALYYFNATTNPSEVFMKGTSKWMFAVSAGNRLDTLDSKRYIYVGGKTTTTSIAVAIGPWDSSSTPVS